MKGGTNMTLRTPQNPVALTKALLAEHDKPLGHCALCGAPAKGGDICYAHSDLVKGTRA